MSWSGGTYTKYTSWTTGTTITSTAHNAQDDDFTAGINNCVAKDGSNQMTGNLNMGGFRFSNVAAGSAATPCFSPGADVDTGMYLAGTNTIGFSTAAVERMRIASDGTTTISSAQAILNIGSTSTATETCAAQIGNGRTGSGNSLIDLIGDTTYTDFGARLIRYGGANGITEFSHRGTGDLKISGNEASRLLFVTNNTDRVQVASDGVVSVLSATPTLRVGTSNTSTQDATFTVGAGRTGSGNSVIDLVGDTTYPAYGFRFLRTAGANGSSFAVHRGTGNFVIRAEDAGFLQFDTSSTERMRITSGGDIYSGTTTASGTAGALEYKRKAGGTIWQHGPATAGTGNSFYVLNGSDIGVRLDSGNTSWTANSDARQKKNIQDLSYGLNQIQALRPVRFDYLSEESEESKRIGFIAQEVLPHVPEAVSGSEETSYGLATAELIPVLVAAIKELAAKVEALEAS